MSLTELKAEIARETTLLEGFKDQLTEATVRRRETQRLLERERLPPEERLRVREATIRELETRIRERAIKIWDLEQAIRRHEERLPRVSPVERYVTRRVIATLRRTIASYRGWQTRDRRSLTTYRGWQTREVAAVIRFERIQRELDSWNREVSILTSRITDVETELEKKHEAYPKYLLVEYTKFFDVIVRDPTKTPEISFELRGEFTIPAEIDPADSRVLKVIEDKLRGSFEAWGSPTRETKEFAPYRFPAMPGQRYEVREEGGYWRYTTTTVKNIYMEHYEQREGTPYPTYGAEAIEESDAFRTVVDVTIAKYKKGRVVDTWETRVSVREDEFPEVEK
ncbi:hypothetical protein ES702_01424 [subsurface metagenome]